ncbi:hypothetical protein OJ963_41880 [Streptomyces sp. RS2]|nr:hypothetical protein [Streptomyces sp. RS2]MCW1100306.1 hypothetical protein [Streptomyces sp. RS2]
MTELDKSEGHCRCCSRREQPKRVSRWLGFLVHVVYEVARNWPW